MAPPKRATPRRVGSQETRQVARATSGQTASNAPENPDDSTSSLPQVRTRQSFSYGTTKTPPMPAPLERNPNMNSGEMLNSLNAGLSKARERERELANTRQQAQVIREGQVRTRAQARRSQSIEPSPTPPQTLPSNRQMTPDDQLMESLRESSEDSRYSSHRENSPSDSVISWRIERDIHGNQDISGRDVEKTRGMATLAAKPRRPIKASGLRDMIKEEPEEADEFGISSVPASEEVSTNNTEAKVTQETATTARRSPVENISANVPQSIVSATSIAESVRDFISNTSPSIPVAPTLIRKLSFSPLSFLTFLFAIVAMFGTYTFSDKLIEIPHALGRFPIFGGTNPPHAEYNVSDLAGHASAINHLSSQIDRLGEKFRDMSNEINDLKDDWGKKLPLINEVIPRIPQPPPSETPRDPLGSPRVNFCSPGLGAVVNPYKSTPGKIEEEHSYFTRLRHFVTFTRKGSSASSALKPWEGVGDCFCSARQAEITQLAVELGGNVVPEEVVIEHIAKGATLDPGTAPRDMELWAEYDIDSYIDTESNSPFPLHDTIMDTLREAYPGEPESAYSDNEDLGLDYYRVGKWVYDVNADNPIQAFPLNAVIDLPGARVGKVIFRATTNWGSDHTCFYRVRLHGS